MPGLTFLWMCFWTFFLKALLSLLLGKVPASPFIIAEVQCTQMCAGERLGSWCQPHSGSSDRGHYGLRLWRTPWIAARWLVGIFLMDGDKLQHKVWESQGLGVQGHCSISLWGWELVLMLPLFMKSCPKTSEFGTVCLPFFLVPQFFKLTLIEHLLGAKHFAGINNIQHILSASMDQALF